MKHLPDCGRLINTATSKLTVSTSVTINSETLALTFISGRKAAINQLFGLLQNCYAKWGRWWVVTKNFNFSLKTWHATSFKM